MQDLIAGNPQAAENFRFNVRALLDQRGLTITKLSGMCGVMRPGLSRILSNKEGVTLDRAEKIAKALGLPLSALISVKFDISA